MGLSSSKKFFKLILERERERKGEREILTSCSTYPCIYCLSLVCALTGNRTLNLGISG